MAKKQGNLDQRLFPASPCVRVDFFLQQLHPLPVKKLILGAKTRFCGNSHISKIMRKFEVTKFAAFFHFSSRP